MYTIILLFSTYPCVYCISPKRDWNTDLTLEGAELRLHGDIRFYALEYQEANELHLETHVNKLSSADYYNCERLPIDSDIPDDVSVLSVFPPEVGLPLLLLTS